MKLWPFVLYKIFILVILSGCATIKDSPSSGVKFDQVIEGNTKELIAFKQKAKEKTLAVRPLLASGKGRCFQTKESEPDYPYRQEANYLNHWPPRVGLALSGGGVRATSFGIGVMKALNDAKKIDEMDLISSVSGGS